MYQSQFYNEYIAIYPFNSKDDKHIQSFEINRKNEIETYNEDQLRYMQTGYSFICDYDPTKTMLRVGSHHKTGTIISCQKIFPTIITYWMDKCTNLITPDINSMNHDYHALQQEVEKVTGRIFIGHIQSHDISAYISMIHDNQHMMLLHFIRNPVDTILSGYNYHKLGTATERWLREIPTKLKRRVDLCLKMNDILYNMNHSYLNDTLLNIYNNNGISIGIEIEYYRYIECVFNEIYKSYNLIEQMISKYGDNNYVHLKNIRMEDLLTNFNQTMLSILDTMGIIDNIDRNNVMELLQPFDIKNMNFKSEQHITKGTYDKDEQINILLSDINRCQLLRNITINLNYNWLHVTYC